MKNLTTFYLKVAIRPIMVLLFFANQGYSQGSLYSSEELSIWQQRAIAGPFKSNGDAFTGSPGEWDRIVGQANYFVNNDQFEIIFEGPQGGPASEDEGPELRQGAFGNMMSAAFADLVLGTSNYKPYVKQMLLEQAQEPGADFSNRTLYPVTNISDYVWNYAEWQIKYLRAYDYLGESYFTNSEDSIMKKWFRDGAEWHEGIINNNLNQAFNNTRGIPVENYIFNPNYSSSNIYTHRNGYKVYAYGNWYNNRRTAQISFVTHVGVILDDESMKEVGETTFKEWMAFWWYPDGYHMELHRGDPNMPNGPSAGIAYGSGTITNMTNVAHILNLDNHVNLFDYSTSVYVEESDGSLAQDSVNKSLDWALLKYRENFMDDQAPLIYPYGSTGNSTDLLTHYCLSTNETTNNQIIRMYFSSSVANNYYNNPLIAEMYSSSAGNICGVTNNTYLRHGPNGTIPGYLFMYADTEDTTPPTIPSNLIATDTTSTSITLAWSASSDNVGVAGYKVYRDSVAIDTTTSLTYIDSGLSPNTTYFYEVTAFDSIGNESLASNYVSISTKSSELPSPWQHQDIGTVGIAGNVVYDSGVFTVESSGIDFYFNSDAFHYVYQPLSGDGEIIARVTSVEHTSDHAKAGVMIRESLDSNSVNGVVYIRPTGNVQYTTRKTTGGSSSYVNGSSTTTPEWLRLVRTGDLIETYQSSNGSSWSLVESDTLVMSTNVYIGLALGKGEEGDLNTSTFDNVSVTGTEDTTPPTIPGNLIATDTTSTSITLAWNASSDNVGVAGYKVYRDSVAIDTTTSLTYIDSGLSPNTTYFYEITAFDSTGNESLASNYVSISTKSSELPSPWQHQDIGTVGIAGNVVYDSGVFTVESSGIDFYFNSDAFHYVYQSLPGDGEIIARVTSVEHTSDHAKAGVMIRESLDSNSVNGVVYIRPTGNVQYTTRKTTGGSSSYVNGSSATTPEWLRLVRTGDLIETYQSSNGSSWSLVESDTLVMTTNVYIGLALGKGEEGDLNTSTFDNVSVSNNSSARLGTELSRQSLKTKLNNQNNEILYYPNPVTDKLTIANLPNESRILVFNLLGSKIKEEVNFEKTEVSISTNKFYQGVYRIVIYNEKTLISSFNIIKH